MMKKLFTLLLTALLFGGLQPASAQVFEWATLLRNTTGNGSVGQGATTDLGGNTYIAGRGGAIVKYD